MNLLFAYGTLRPRDEKGNYKPHTHFITGYKLFDVGPFPFIAKAGKDDIVYGNVLDATDDQMKGFDRYEGCSHGFYTREETLITSSWGVEEEQLHGFVYVGGTVAERGGKEIPNGDWAKRNQA